jgi:hypothetical protein
MSAHATFSRHARQAADRAVTRAYADLRPDDRGAFADLLLAVRIRSTARIDPPVVAALRNIARHAAGYRRPLDEWTGLRSTMYPVIHALAQHLLARYAVPRFLASVWYGDGGWLADAKRRWFIAHAAGVPFRDLDLPIAMTRRMESIFLGSPDHVGVEAALRRAELLSLGAKDELVEAVLATRLGRELANGEFWRTVMQFFVRFADRIAPAAVAPIVDFIQFIRHERVEVVTPDGVRVVDPPEPCFSVKGRSPASLQRLVDEWHRRLGGQSAGALVWSRSRFRPLAFEERSPDPDRPPVRWELVELTSGADLRAEGAALHHCVATYAQKCLWGLSRIWSLRVTSGWSGWRSVATIEVDPGGRAVVQARGMRNQAPSARARDLIFLWARRENLRLQL